MNVIIDTHIFLWLLEASRKIKTEHLNILKDKNNTIYLSSISVAEIMIKKSIGKLDVDFDITEMLKQMGIKSLSYDTDAALKLIDLPFHHKDPFDRMIISQGIINNFKILTLDSKFKYYDCELID